jgi:octaprenyl-diphosphate synthase
MDGFGRDLGIAFQIADDLLDVLGEDRTTGKSLGTDLEKQKPTLPIIRALQTAGDEDRQALLDLLNGDNRSPEALLPLLHKGDGLEYARKRACWYAQRARQRLDVLPASAARMVLASMAEFVVSRSH